MNNSPLIDITDLRIGFDSSAKSELFYPLVNSSALKGEFIALIGRNGVGKSTFLRSIAKLQPAISGDILLKGRSFKQIDRIEYSKILSFIPAEPIHAANMNVTEFVTIARYPYRGWFGGITKDDKEIVQFALQSVGLHDFSKRELDTLSDGERQRAMIAFAIAQDSEIVLMDEPTAFIDLPAKYEIVHLLKELTKKGKTVIFSTHDLHTAMREVDTIWLMLNDGLKVGAPEDLALENTFNRLFLGTNIYLDLSSGSFVSKAVFEKTIGLVAENDICFSWTKRALERIGYNVVSDQSTNNCIVQCFSVDNKNSWNVTLKSNAQQFDSLNSLCNFLKTNNP